MRTYSLVFTTIGVLASAALCVDAADGKKTKTSTPAGALRRPRRHPVSRPVAIGPTREDAQGGDADQGKSGKNITENRVTRGCRTGQQMLEPRETGNHRDGGSLHRAYVQKTRCTGWSPPCSRQRPNSWTPTRTRCSRVAMRSRRLSKNTSRRTPKASCCSTSPRSASWGLNLAIEDGTTVFRPARMIRPWSAAIRRSIRRPTVIGKSPACGSMDRAILGSARPRLKQLDWLVGNWVDEADDSVVHFSTRMSRSGNFLIRDFKKLRSAVKR